MIGQMKATMTTESWVRFVDCVLLLLLVLILLLVLLLRILLLLLLLLLQQLLLRILLLLLVLEYCTAIPVLEYRGIALQSVVVCILVLLKLVYLPGCLFLYLAFVCLFVCVMDESMSINAIKCQYNTMFRSFQPKVVAPCRTRGRRRQLSSSRDT